MKAVYLNRLAKLATHLEKGKLAHKKFDFSSWNSSEHGVQLEVNGCGFSGCAIGECPALFPRHWKWMAGHPVAKKLTKSLTGNTEVWDQGKKFFGLNGTEFAGLFTPSSQEALGLPRLSSDSTKRAVAKNIRAFIAIKKQKGAGHSANP